jgi:CHAT domain-containing protein/tetratricopeptide (TPR) repeat protein
VIFNNFAVLLRKQGRSVESRGLLEQLYEISSAYPPEGRSLAESILHNLATALFAQGYMAEAEAGYRRLLAGGASGQRDPGSTLTNLAFAIEAQGRLEDAESEHRKALALRTSAEGGQGLETAASMNNLGSNLTAQGRFAEAEPLLRASLSTRERIVGPSNLNVGFSLAALANNLMMQGKSGEAMVLAERLVHLRRTALGDLHPETAAAFQLLAIIALDVGKHDSAIKSARSALAARVPETLREEAALSDNARMVLRREPGITALTLARAAWMGAGGRTLSWEGSRAPPLAAEAFLAAQRIPVTTTADALSLAAARRAADGAGLGELAQQLESKLSARMELDRSLVEAATRGKELSELRTRQARLEMELSEVEITLRRSYPKFFEYVRPQPLDFGYLNGANGVLRKDEVLILLTPGAGKQKGLVFAITREGGVWAEISLDPKELQAKIRRFRLLLDLAAARRSDAPAPTSGTGDFDWALASELYAALFSEPEVAARVRSKRRWILAPQGMLISLPYAALVSTPPADQPYAAATLRKAPWVGVDKVISIVPSVASVQALRNNAMQGSRPSRPFFGVGDPVFAGKTDSGLHETGTYYRDRLADVEALRQLPRLPGTALEIAQMARALGAGRNDYLLAEQATESEIKSRNARGDLFAVSIVAFATHGLLNGDLRNSLAEPALALTPPASPTETDDGLLTASEAAHLRLNADWVLLSACNTAAGDQINGEGLTGLARAFILAGGRALIASHWRLPDDVAGRITTRAVAISRARSDISRGEALQLAVQEVIADQSRDGTSAPFSHPGLWAAFAYIGLD